MARTVAPPAPITRRSLSDEFRRLIAEADRYADQVDRTPLSATPLTGLAILTCMDARIVIEDIFGLRAGDANVIRNAGAVASDDAIRSLLLSRHMLGATEVVVMGHTGCGLRELDDEALRTRLLGESGAASDTHFGSFRDVDAHVKDQAERIRAHPWMRNAPVHTLVFEVETGRVREVR